MDDQGTASARDHRGRLEQRAGDGGRDDRRRAHQNVARRDAGDVALERAERDILLVREAVEERLGRTEQILVEDDVADARHREAAAFDQADKPAAGEMDRMTRHIEMEPSPPADPRLEAVEVGHRDDDSAVAAKRLDRAAQPQFGVVEMLEHVPEDDDVRTFGRRAKRLDRRIQDLQPRVALCRVRLDPDDAAVLLRPAGG